MLTLDLPALSPEYLWEVQAGPPGMPLTVYAHSPHGTVTIYVTGATYDRHHTAATLACDIAQAVRQMRPSLPASCRTL